MTISVVIPAYNEEALLPKTLTSLRHLIRKPDEIIVIDGGSTDGTKAIARRSGASVYTIQHRGIGYARQQGIEHAKGDVIAFTDADTLVPDDWLTKIEQTLSRPSVSCVFGTFRVPDGWLPYRIYINRLQPILNQFYFWMGIPMAPGQNIAFWKKKALAVGGFPTDFKIAEDIEMARRLKRTGKLVLRQDLIVVSSGRRGSEGPGLLLRTFKAFFLYLFFRKANTIGFPDIR
ncbi:glycosyltransferase [Patescibacteria group bacterium]|nr:glycosyltransferase [Patescibacteria group bacterium]